MEFDTISKPELCRMEVKVWLSGDNPDLESQFLEHSLAHLISGAMTESPLMRYTLTPDGIGHVEYPKERES
ncbi:MAG: hypothetical protein P4L77_12090 [Sulfuriferula sp.]|nr:hypothetical protein [Sulfuriferula sp.]